MISILIPIYNGIKFIEESVSSVLNQTYTEWEILIGINGHLQNSDVYLTAKKYENRSPKIRVFDFYNIKGKSETLNYMLQYCRYNHIAILDVDDIWHPQKLEIQVLKIQEYDVVGSKCIYFGDMEGIVPAIPENDLTDFNFALFNPIINSSAIIKKDLCYWNENGVEDYDLWLTLKKQNKKFYNCKEILIKHRIHSESAFNSKGNENLVEGLLKKHGLK